MYSLILVTAMTTTPDATQFNGFFRDLFSGCSGCSSTYTPRYSCYGGGSGSSYTCSGSAYPASCTGCCGGEGLGTRVRRWFSNLISGCCGCCGGSGSGYACYGSGYGCTGTSYSCFGTQAYSCFGSPASSYTPTFNAGLTCQGGPVWGSAPSPTFEPYPSYPTMPQPAPPSIPYAPPEAAPGMSFQNNGLRPAAYSDSQLVSNGNATARATVVV